MQSQPNSWKKTWHSDDDFPMRRELLGQILKLFTQRKPNCTPEWQQKLPIFVQRMEEALYRKAVSKEEYSDFATLDARLQQIAGNMVQRPTNISANSGTQQQLMMQQQQQQQQQQMGQGMGNMQAQSGTVMNSNLQMSGGNMMVQAIQNSPVDVSFNGSNSTVLQQPNNVNMLGGNNQQQMLRSGLMANGSNTVANNGAMVQQIQGNNGVMNSNVLQQQQQQQTTGNQMMSTAVGRQTTNGAMRSRSLQQQDQRQQRLQGVAQRNPGTAPQQFQATQGQRSLTPNTPQQTGQLGLLQGQVPVAETQNQVQLAEHQRVYVGKQQRWLLLLRHASKCSVPEGTCSAAPHCQVAKQLVNHVTQCQDAQCKFPRCVAARDLLRHHMRCQEPTCVICTPVREYMQRQRADALELQQRQLQQQQLPNQSQPNQQRQQQQQLQQQQQQLQQQQLQQQQQQLVPQPHQQLQQQQQPQQQQVNLPNWQNTQQNVHTVSTMVPVNLSGNVDSDPPSVSTMVPTDAFGSSDMDPLPDWNETPTNASSVKRERDGNGLGFGSSLPSTSGNTSGSQVAGETEEPDNEKKRRISQSQSFHQTPSQSQSETAGALVKYEAKPETGPSGGAASTGASAGWVEGTSMLETFSLEQVQTHLNGLREWAAIFTSPQSAKRSKESQLAVQQALGSGEEANQCRSCGLEKLFFEAPSLYCGTCGVRVRRNQMHYVSPQASSGAGEVQKQLFCMTCYNDIKGDTVELQGISIAKSKLEKRKNDEEQLEEAWVECDKCQSWHHQICVMFNGRRNEGEKTLFHCPMCIRDGLMKGERQPVTNRPPSQLPAEALPKTKLSDYLEERLKRSLQKEQQKRAQELGKDTVETAEGLVVRIVSNIEKKVETKSQFYKAFQHMGFPGEFGYKSKVLLLFQKQDGADVCLFSMYMQEYGADAPAPNTRRVYLSYLDSVKYLRPEVPCAQAMGGAALRTFVYHDILVGYLQYVKVRGFTSMYIWACPPLAGEDYILYCHPSRQKIPKSDKLRAWYLTMLNQAKQEKTVTHTCTIYDAFFTAGREKKTRSASEMPYFDGDCWPGTAEDALVALENDTAAGAGGKRGGKGASKKGNKGGKANFRGKQASGGVGVSQLEPFDAALMTQLGEVLGGPMKEDFILAHLHHCCTHCGEYINGGTRYYVNEPNVHISICDPCFRADQLRSDYDKIQYSLQMEQVKPFRDTEDPDEVMESEFFDTRQAFLSLCQGNHFQFDALRRSKHSSMMVLYHLHNPSEPAFVSTCNVCQMEIPAGHGWRCTVCPDYDVCDNCQRNHSHPHALRSQSSQGRGGAWNAQLSEERKQRLARFKRTMDLLVHASACNILNCGTSDCHKVKTLFQHGVKCPKKAAGGCPCCRRVCQLLHVHAKSCKAQDCPVPRCRELKEYRRKLQTQMEDRRRQNALAMYRGQQSNSQ